MTLELTQRHVVKTCALETGKSVAKCCLARSSLEPKTSFNNSNCLAPDSTLTSLPSRGQNTSRNGVLYEIETVWTPVIWDKEGARTRHWRDVIFMGCDQLCTGSRTHNNWPRNEMLFGSQLTQALCSQVAYTIRTRPPSLGEKPECRTRRGVVDLNANDLTKRTWT